MSKVKLQPTIAVEIDDILDGVARLEMRELESFTDRVMELRARRRAPRLSKEESDLLQKINQGVPAEVRRRYNELNEKLHDEVISAEEHQEFLAIVEQIKLSDAERLHSLMELAQIRRMTVDALMEQLGIRQPAYG